MASKTSLPFPTYLRGLFPSSDAVIARIGMEVRVCDSAPIPVGPSSAKRQSEDPALGPRGGHGRLLRSTLALPAPGHNEALGMTKIQSLAIIISKLACLALALFKSGQEVLAEAAQGG